MKEKYTVYVKTDAVGCITAINSSAFVDGSGWAAIDEGAGDRFHHAQNNYMPLPLYGPDGCANYKLADGVPVERTQAEKAADLATRPAAGPTQLDRVAAQTAYTAMCTDTLLTEV